MLRQLQYSWVQTHHVSRDVHRPIAALDWGSSPWHSLGLYHPGISRSFAIRLCQILMLPYAMHLSQGCGRIPHVCSFPKHPDESQCTFWSRQVCQNLLLILISTRVDTAKSSLYTMHCCFLMSQVQTTWCNVGRSVCHQSLLDTYVIPCDAPFTRMWKKPTCMQLPQRPGREPMYILYRQVGQACC